MSLSSFHHDVEGAAECMWDCRFQEAESLLQPQNVQQPRCALEFAMCFLLKTLLNMSNEGREKLLELFKIADNLASSAKGTTPQVSLELRDEGSTGDVLPGTQTGSESTNTVRQPLTPAELTKYWKLECDIVYADALLVRAVLQLMMNSYVRGGINLRKVWGLYHNLMKQAENDKDMPAELKLSIKCGCGLFYAFLALVPAGLMRLLSAIGFISDKELGELYLTEVFDSISIRSPAAALGLCTYYLFLPTGLGDVETTLSKAKLVLDKMNQRFPQNTPFHGYLNFFHRKRGEPRQALEAIEIATSNAERCGLVPLLLRYLHADTLLMDLQFEAARDKYLDVLETLKQTGETFAYTGQVVLSLAACYATVGDKETALQWLKKVASMHNSKSRQDVNSPKFASKVLAQPALLPLLGVYVLYINRDLAHMKPGHVVQLKTKLDELIEGCVLTHPEVSGLHDLFQAVFLKCSGETEKAYNALSAIVNGERKYGRDSIVLAYAYYEVGELEFRRGNVLEAKRLLEKGAELRGDGHETLSNRYRIALKQIKRRHSS